MGVGSLIDKAKTAVKLVKAADKAKDTQATLKKTNKLVTTTEKVAKQEKNLVKANKKVVYERAMSKAELKNTQKRGVLRGDRGKSDDAVNYFTDKIKSKKPGTIAKKYGLDSKPEYKVKFEITTPNKQVIKTPGAAKPGKLGKGGGTEFTTNGKTEIKILNIDKLKK